MLGGLNAYDSEFAKLEVTRGAEHGNGNTVVSLTLTTYLSTTTKRLMQTL